MLGYSLNICSDESILSATRTWLYDQTRSRGPNPTRFRWKLHQITTSAFRFDQFLIACLCRVAKPSSWKHFWYFRLPTPVISVCQCRVANPTDFLHNFPVAQAGYCLPVSGCQSDFLTVFLQIQVAQAKFCLWPGCQAGHLTFWTSIRCSLVPLQ